MLLKWLTPFLAVCGPDWPGETFSMSEVTRAVDWIQMGHNAYVANDEVAAAILQELGITPERVAEQMYFATPGNVDGCA